ncbi:hypothetical protein DTO006G1_6650 [Penicillium roqueforti]|nr:hypothetical protein CBS147337_3939 [Penicillium roqueforti]KAI2712515.1 hypothetical protein CBS147354_8021 [Penicillium roqueforti]KAI2758436.1 hypothetical protein DTO006G1_6650 [Penicillium roqueforti]KAI3109154.1 hypothetical protein CBS147333_5784 [Penicillium roqueforti]KAI3253832.1 hypothetical protein DTO006G7_5526 [Penicillium roqueforti]
MAVIQAKWTKVVEAEVLQRSSQVVSVIDGQVYIFGGELRPREPRDNNVHIVSLGRPATLSTKPSTDKSPSPRVGTASATLNGKIYLFSGRGGAAMAPVEESGAIWEFNPASDEWSLLSPSDANPSSIPAARSYHCTASDGKDTVFIHAGCPEKGRLSDLWAFSVSQKQWTELASAPDPPRGGTSIAFAQGRLYRMNGFDGEREQGGRVDVYEPETNMWSSHSFVSDGMTGPSPRSVAALLPVVVSGRVYLVTLFGEQDPSSLGHQGAGKMLGDVWLFDVETQLWTKVEAQGDERPDPRGWFDGDVLGNGSIVVHGGLGESNNRLGDLWTLEFV